MCYSISYTPLTAVTVAPQFAGNLRTGDCHRSNRSSENLLPRFYRLCADRSVGVRVAIFYGFVTQCKAPYYAPVVCGITFALRWNDAVLIGEFPLLCHYLYVLFSLTACCRARSYQISLRHATQGYGATCKELETSYISVRRDTLSLWPMVRAFADEGCRDGYRITGSKSTNLHFDDPREAICQVEDG